MSRSKIGSSLLTALVTSIVMFASPLLPAALGATTVYFNDFQTAVGSQWSPGGLIVSTTPSGSRFLGRDPVLGLGTETVGLSLTGLPSHTAVTLSFDLYIIQSWDGVNAAGGGQDRWTLAVAGGPTLLDTNFSFGGNNQAYPDPIFVGNHPPRTGAFANDALGYLGFQGHPWGDSTYRLSFTLPHTSSSIQFNFRGDVFQGVADESWGLDNVRVDVIGEIACEVPDADRVSLDFPTTELSCPSTSCVRREALPGTRSDGPTGLPCLVDETIKDARGVNFEIWCADWVNPRCNKCIGFYRRDGGRSLAGKCWFDGGQNTVSIEYSSQNVSADGVPECFVSSRWNNFQVLRNEPDPPLPNQPPGPLSGGRYPADDELDTWTYVHHVPVNKTDIMVLKDSVEVFHRDPDSGSGFNDLPPVLGDLPDPSRTKTVLPADEALCDLNRDGRCDGADFLLFRSALGSCRGNPSYNVLADANLDGCVTPGDERVLFPTIPFDVFTAKVEIELGSRVNDDAFEVKAAFILVAGSNGIDPLKEDVTLDLKGGTGAFSTTIPADSFKKDKKGHFKFEGAINGVELEAKITPLGNNSFEFKAEGEHANLHGIAKPVTIKLTIGDDSGRTTLTAKLEKDHDERDKDDRHNRD